MCFRGITLLEPLTSWVTLECLNYLSLSFPWCKNGNRIDTVWLIRQWSEMCVELMIPLQAPQVHITTTYRRHKGDLREASWQSGENIIKRTWTLESEKRGLIHRSSTWQPLDPETLSYSLVTCKTTTVRSTWQGCWDDTRSPFIIVQGIVF